jgi:hypothetical protein
MDTTQLQLWNMILTTAATVTVVIGAIAGAIKYFQERQRDREVRLEELSWRKTQFVFELAENFDRDERFQVAYKMIEFGIGIPHGSTLARMLGPDIQVLSADEIEGRYTIDRYLDFFDRLYHFAFVTKFLNVRDLECFLWYLRRIGETQVIREYAAREGYGDVLVLYQELRSLSKYSSIGT